MCIRDRFRTIGDNYCPGLRRKADSAGYIIQTKIRKNSGYHTSVSYTHLDVYKRQHHRTAPVPDAAHAVWQCQIRLSDRLHKKSVSGYCAFILAVPV